MLEQGGGIQKPCPENIEISICHELNYELGRALRSSWGDTLGYRGYVGEICSSWKFNFD